MYVALRAITWATARAQQAIQDRFHVSLLYQVLLPAPGSSAAGDGIV
jgi:hypothetical protein